MDIYSHEILSYKKEIIKLESHFNEPSLKIDNLTHHSLGLSNRANSLFINLCALLESFLYKTATDIEKVSSVTPVNNLDDFSNIQTYLKKTKLIPFGKIQEWEKLTHIYKIRNILIHSYGGMIRPYRVDEIEKSLKKLNFESCLFSNRVRINIESLLHTLTILESFITKINDTTNIIKEKNN